MATANLSVESKDFTLPVVEATAGADGIVVSTLRNDGWVTLDPGFLTTAQCESKITYIDGKNSILRYRGYPIEQLCEQSDFLEVAWLLRHGELPNKDQYDRFISDINHRTMVGEDFRTFMGSFPRTAHPMSVMASAVNALATFYPDTTDINDSDQLDEAATIIMAKRAPSSATSSAAVAMSRCCTRTTRAAMLTISCACASPCRMSRSNPILCTCTRLAVCSSSMPTTSRTAPRPWCASPVRARQPVFRGRGRHQRAVRPAARRRQRGGAPPAQGHPRLRQNRQGIRGGREGQRASHLRPRPSRVQVVRSARGDRQDLSAEDHGTRRHAEAAADERALFDVATELEQIALSDDYFVSRHLYPNVDFYTGLIYRAIGFDPSMFTTLFALGRIPGWIAQYREMLADPNTKIGRPRQVYTGYTERDYVPMDQRH